VEWAETAEMALSRELDEETGVELTGPVELHGLFANFEKFPGDHIAFYVVRNWRRPVVPAANAEIINSGFFAPAAVPSGTVPGARRRLAEMFDGAVKSPKW